jgi:hypothetical protein
MAGFGNTFKKDLTQYIFRGTALPNAITTLYISLHTGDPGADGQSGNEVSGGSYARVSVAQGTTNWGAATTANPSVIANAVAFTFPTATANWGTVTYFGIWQSSSGTATTNFIGGQALTASQVVNSGNTASFAIGALTHSLTG